MVRQWSPWERPNNFMTSFRAEKELEEEISKFARMCKNI